MNNCKNCGKEIDEKYKYCYDCNQVNKQQDSTEIVAELGKINNNLYYIRRALAYTLAKKYNTEIVWNKEESDFTEKEIK